MSHEEYNKYFEILELTPNASLPEVRKAYLALKDLYSTASIVTVPFEDDITDEDRTRIVEQIEDAYFNLLGFFDQKKKTNEHQGKHQTFNKDLDEIISKFPVFSGHVLREIREHLNIGLYDVALATNIQIHHLENIEIEKYDALPAELYTRGFVKSYAKYLSLDSKAVADDYMKRYHSWKNEKSR